MTKTFNMQMNIAKAIGIIAVVAGHSHWNIFGDFFISYSWQQTRICNDTCKWETIS